MGIRTVAVYSEPDRASLHVRYADEAVALGGKTPAESYLRMDAILEIAQRVGAEAIHPGFGFLAENGEFAAKVQAAGLVFIGPSPEAMVTMGDKLASRCAMVAAGVPVVPGAIKPAASVQDACESAQEVGYPIMLKASAGGGGKGIRIVRTAEEMDSAFAMASGEALSAFGDGRMYVEKLIENPRHVEVQILGDRYGKVIAVGERECSVQRRHQKLVEECPSPAVDAAARLQLSEAAIAAAKTVDYCTAGTVEFLWLNGKFWFLEMNTRIQVEHGISEEVYGVDLIEWMLRTAAGEALPFENFLEPKRHAIEVRINAEDSEMGFMPAMGLVRNLRLPGGSGIRVDAALHAGMEVTPYYDSMLAKIIASGPTRKHALARMERALQELHVGGLPTTVPIALQVLRHPSFRSGQYSTAILENILEGESSSEQEHLQAAAIIAALHRFHMAKKQLLRTEGRAGASSNPWQVLARREQMRGMRS